MLSVKWGNSYPNCHKFLGNVFIYDNEDTLDKLDSGQNDYKFTVQSQNRKTLKDCSNYDKNQSNQIFTEWL